MMLGTHAAPATEYDPVPNSIAGTWIAYDDDGSALARIEIRIQGRHAEGRIVTVLARDPSGREPVCARCPGDARGKALRGLRILDAERNDRDGSWHGEVLDPGEETVYRCTVQLAENGNRLRVRGYVGLPWLGRTEYWTRAPS